MSFSNLLIHIIEIWRNTPVTNDNAGNPKVNYMKLNTVSGRLEELSGKLFLVDGIQVVSNHILYLPSGTDIKELDHVIYNGQTYKVIFPRHLDNGIGPDHIEVDLMKVSYEVNNG